MEQEGSREPENSRKDAPPSILGRTSARRLLGLTKNRWFWFGCGGAAASLVIILGLGIPRWTVRSSPGYSPAPLPIPSQDGSLDAPGAKVLQSSSLDMITSKEFGSSPSVDSRESAEHEGGSIKEPVPGPRPLGPGAPVRGGQKLAPGGKERLNKGGTFGGGGGSIVSVDARSAANRTAGESPAESRPSSLDRVQGGPQAGRGRVGLGPRGKDSAKGDHLAWRTGQNAMTKTGQPNPAMAGVQGGFAGSDVPLPLGGYGIRGEDPRKTDYSPGSLKKSVKEICTGGKVWDPDRGMCVKLPGSDEETACKVKVVRHNPSDPNACVIACQNGKACVGPKGGSMCRMPSGTDLSCTGAIAPLPVVLIGEVSRGEGAIQVTVTNPNSFAMRWRARWFYNDGRNVWEQPQDIAAGQTVTLAKELTLKSVELWGDDTLYSVPAASQAAGTANFRLALTLPVPPKA